MRILVVCGAGASSTFVAQRVRRAAHEPGLPYSAVAGTTGSLVIDLDSADIVLVGPPLPGDRKSGGSGKSVAVSLEPRGSRRIKQTQNQNTAQAPLKYNTQNT